MKHILTLLVMIGLSYHLIDAQNKHSIYDEINQIKREGSAYDDSVSTPPQYENSWRGYIEYINSQPLNQTASTPLFASSKYKGYGDSKYDKGLTFFDEMSSDSGSLENLRNKARQKEQKKIVLNISIGVAVLALIIFLVRRSNYLKLDSDETNK